MVGIFPNDAAIERLVGAVLLEQDESMAEIPAMEDLPTQTCLQEATA